MGIFSKKKTVTDVPDAEHVKAQGQEPRDHTAMEKLRQGFDAAYYLTINIDVLASGMDPLEHYMVHGWREGRHPNDWFDPEAYLARNPALVGSEINPFVHFLLHKNTSAEGLRDRLADLHLNRAMYWSGIHQDPGDAQSGAVIVTAGLPKKKDLRIVRKTFDSAYYAAKNPDLVGKVSDLFLHFMTLGWIELRDPNADFSITYYLRNNEDVRRRGDNPYLYHLKHGHEEAWRLSASVKDVEILDYFETDPHMMALVAQAKALEPMVGLPAQKRVITSPLKAAGPATDVAEALRRKLGGKTYKYVVAVPHVRMSGASRVAAIFADALADVRDPSEILVITTDSSESEYIDWFSDRLEIFDLSKEIAPLTSAAKTRALIDVLRGVECQMAINVNSRLVWEAMRAYGRQMHHEFRVLTYLFTWEENARGDRLGYPIQWLRDTAEHHHLIMTDTKALADDIKARLGFETGNQVVPLYTPVTDAVAAVANRTKPRNKAGHFLWAGRFDPQKRLDILVAIARANPDMTFDVYGKTVLGKDDLDTYDPPDNIIAKGTYTDLQEVLETPYTGFLYTAQWDGLPTILLDMAAAGLPIAASNVGGIGEMLGDETGWLVADFEDIAGYSAALKEMAADPDAADVRVAALRTRLAEQFARAHYVSEVKALVGTHDL